MKKRARKSKRLYFICVNKSTFEPVIFSTKRAVAAYIGVDESTLYRQFLVSNRYHQGDYVVWCNMSIYLCDKGLAS